MAVLQNKIKISYKKSQVKERYTSLFYITRLIYIYICLDKLFYKGLSTKKIFLNDHWRFLPFFKYLSIMIAVLGQAEQKRNQQQILKYCRSYKAVKKLPVVSRKQL